MTECPSLRTTMTMIKMGLLTVHFVFAEVGGITHVTGQILMGSMGTEIMAKESIGITGEVSITL